MINGITAFEKMEFGLLRRLSYCLDISFSELMEIKPVLIPTRDKQNIIRGYTVWLEPHAPATILKKIKRLSPGNKVHLHYYAVNDLLPVTEIKHKNS